MSCHHRRFVAGCGGCQRVSTAYDRRRRAAIKAGTWQPQMPAQAVLDHIDHLRRNGMSLRAIARHAHLAHNTIYSVLYQPRKVVHGSTAAAILAVQPTAVIRAGLVPTIGATRRVQALVAIGWTLTAIATQCGHRHLQWAWELAHATSPAISEASHWAIADTYERLSMTLGGSKRAVNMAARYGWAPPLAWEDIDDPAEQPSLAGRDGPEPGDDPVAIERAAAGDLPLSALPTREDWALALLWHCGRGGGASRFARMHGLSGTTLAGLRELANQLSRRDVGLAA